MRGEDLKNPNAGKLLLNSIPVLLGYPGSKKINIIPFIKLW